MGIFDGWKNSLFGEENEHEDNPEIKKLKEPIKVNVNERGGVAESKRYFTEQSGLSNYARDAHYINTNVEDYKQKTTSRYSAGYHSGTGGKAPNLNRGMGVGPTQKVNAPSRSYHSEQIGGMARLGCKKPLGMGPIGMEANDAVNSGTGNSSSGANSGGSSKLTRPF